MLNWIEAMLPETLGRDEDIDPKEAAEFKKSQMEKYAPLMMGATGSGLTAAAIIKKLKDLDIGPEKAIELSREAGVTPEEGLRIQRVALENHKKYLAKMKNRVTDPNELLKEIDELEKRFKSPVVDKKEIVLKESHPVDKVREAVKKADASRIGKKAEIKPTVKAKPMPKKSLKPSTSKFAKMAKVLDDPVGDMPGITKVTEEGVTKAVRTKPASGAVEWLLDESVDKPKIKQVHEANKLALKNMQTPAKASKKSIIDAYSKAASKAKWSGNKEMAKKALAGAGKLGWKARWPLLIAAGLGTLAYRSLGMDEETPKTEEKPVVEAKPEKEFNPYLLPAPKKATKKEKIFNDLEKLRKELEGI